MYVCDQYSMCEYGVCQIILKHTALSCTLYTGLQAYYVNHTMNMLLNYIRLHVKITMSRYTVKNIVKMYIFMTKLKVAPTYTEYCWSLDGMKCPIDLIFIIIVLQVPYTCPNGTGRMDVQLSM